MPSKKPCSQSLTPLQVQSNQFPFSCCLCQVGFLSEATLRGHLSLVHRISVQSLATSLLSRSQSPVVTAAVPVAAQGVEAAGGRLQCLGLGWGDEGGGEVSCPQGGGDDSCGG